MIRVYAASSVHSRLVRSIAYFLWRLDSREGGEVHILVLLCEKVFGPSRI
jgi:hypothetical protein